MSKTINPSTYIVIHEWAKDFLLANKQFSVSDIIEHIPITEYVCEPNFKELMAQIKNFTIEEVKNIAEEHGFNENICIDLKQKSSLDEFEACVLNDFVTIPASIINELRPYITNIPLVGSSGNEAIICDSENEYLLETNMINYVSAFKQKFNERLPEYKFHIYQDLMFSKNDSPKRLIIWFDDNDKAIHILNAF